MPENDEIRRLVESPDGAPNTALRFLEDWMLAQRLPPQVQERLRQLMLLAYQEGRRDGADQTVKRLKEGPTLPGMTEGIRG